MCRYQVLFHLLSLVTVDAFTPSWVKTHKALGKVHSSSSGFEEQSDDAIQWELFNEHHAKGSWKGVWTTYDYIGDVLDETVASVDLIPRGNDRIEHAHTIVVGAKRSDCATCFDSMETKTLPVAEYTPKELRKSRFASVSMINGPSLLRSGAMATELVLKHGDGRVRVIFQHAPVWEQGIEPGSCPPQGLKLFRAMVSREALRSTAPTAETETADPPHEGDPVFFRPVPPFDWHKKWSGTSWTWGPSTGNRGWSIEEMEDTDAWHGITPVECWNLRLGGIHLQCPRIMTDDGTSICRLAWLPTDDVLLRVEAGVQALVPMVTDDDMLVGFEPPSLVSLRCDTMKKVGELENLPRPSRDWKENIESEDPESEPQSEPEPTKALEAVRKGTKNSTETENSSDSNPIRDSLSL
jgi:hypothetical protein